MGKLGHITIEPFNPYEARFPGRRVISKEVLNLVKYFRVNGYNVSIGSNDDELNLLAQKGIREFFSNPLIIIVASIPATIISALLASYIETHFTPEVKSRDTKIVIEIDQGGRKLRYSHDGSPISDARFNELTSLLKKQKQIFDDSLLVSPANPSRPWPVFVEHADKIIGWANLEKTERGLCIEDSAISSNDAMARIKNGELTGISIGGLVRDVKCTICSTSYFDCPHISGTEYGKKICATVLEKVDLAEISLVKDPCNPECIIEGLSKITDQE